MGNTTLKGMADSIAKAGGGQDLIIKALKAAHSQGYTSGYSDAMLDVRKAKEAGKKVRSDAFKGELDIIDDVIKGKWA